MNNTFKHLKLISVLILTINVYLFITCSLIAQEHKWSWTKKAISQYEFRSNKVVSDSNGNVYIVGFFRGSVVDFGNVKINNCSKEEEIFVAKYDSLGNLIWAEKFGGFSSDNGLCIATDNVGNVCITGYFRSPSVMFGAYKLINTGMYGDVFIAKLDSSGNVLWAKSGNGDANDEARSIAIDSDGNILVTGETVSSSISFDAIKIVNTGSKDMFIAKYDKFGNVLWAKNYGGSTGGLSGSCIIVDGKNNFFVTGYYNSTVVFGHDTLVQTSESIGPDLFIVKFDSLCNTIWAKRYDSTYYTVPNCITTDLDGNVCLTGFFNSDACHYLLVLKYDKNGKLLWNIKTKVTQNRSEGLGIVTDTKNNIYVVGAFNQQEFSIGKYSLINSNTNKEQDGWYSDIFVVKYDASGNIIWAKSAGGPGDDCARSIAIDNNDDLYITGDFSEESLKIGEVFLTIGKDESGIFISKLKLSGK